MLNDFEAPYSLQAEQSVIGSIIINNSCFDDVSNILILNDFYHHQHQLLFQTICQLSLKNQAFDIITLSEYLEKNIIEAGGLVYLTQLIRNTPHSQNIVHYANIVKKQSVKRQLIKIGKKISSLAFNDNNLSYPELIDLAGEHILKISEQNQLQGKGFISSYDSIQDSIDYIEETFNKGESVTGLETGFKDLDKITFGFQPADLIIIAARPSMGKTALMMNIVDNVANLKNGSIGVFSMEMPTRALTLRRISSHSKINHSNIISSANLDSNDFSKIVKSASIISENKVFIDDTGALTPLSLRSKARVLAKQHKDLKLIVIDYLQLMNAPEFKNNRNNEISLISRSIKALAKELNIPIILLSQLNRGCENRENKRPIMSDIRDSGAVEQDADLILFLYRDEVYHPNNLDNKGLAELIIAKNRNGELGTVKLKFIPEYIKFEDI